MPEAVDARTALLLENLDRAFNARSWHGPNLRASLRGVSPEVAAWHPAPGRNGIWKLLLHAAYWKYIARRHIAGDKDIRLPRSPANFPALPDPVTKAALKNDIALLDEQHALLREAVAAFPPDRLHDRPTAKGPTYLDLILGVAAHDLHHAGQIQYIKRLYQAS